MTVDVDFRHNDFRQDSCSHIAVNIMTVDVISDDEYRIQTGVRYNDCRRCD